MSKNYGPVVSVYLGKLIFGPYTVTALLQTALFKKLDYF